MQPVTLNTASPLQAASPSSVSGGGMNTLKSEDFFKILVTELRQQDPFQPAKTADMISQVSQIRGIELSKQLTDTLSQLSRQQHTSGASELLGKYVTAKLRAADGTESDVAGVVTGVRFDTDGTTVLELDTGQTVRVSDVTRISTPEAAQQQAPSAAGQNKTSAATGSTGTQTTGTNTATAPKSEQTAKSVIPRLLPFVSLDGEFHL